MAFDSIQPQRTEAPAAAHEDSLFNRLHAEHQPLRVAATGGSLEPGGPPALEPPPGNTINNYGGRGGDAHSTANATARATSSSDARATGGTATGGNSSTSIRSVFTAPPGLGGGECTTGLSFGALGFALGGQTPNMDCIREKTGAQKEGQTLEFSVQSGVAAANIMDQALANVDRAHDAHRRGADGVAGAHLAGANAQRDISGHMAAESLTAAQRVLGPENAANTPGAWGAEILADRAPAPVPVAETPRPAVVHHQEHKNPPKKEKCP